MISHAPWLSQINYFNSFDLFTSLIHLTNLFIYLIYLINLFTNVWKWFETIDKTRKNNTKAIWFNLFGLIYFEVLSCFPYRELMQQSKEHFVLYTTSVMIYGIARLLMRNVFLRDILMNHFDSLECLDTNRFDFWCWQQESIISTG